ncbi:MAG: HD domain-containing protein [Alteromonas sp.]|uniref:Hydrolase n=1 Tax=Alteromonas australica TaxID=589873 RepID=A0A075P3C2_9ALTE|nr:MULTISPECIES: HD domain-containing protein [Alteromonas]AIF97802.1 hydrolase [Alteromonas australica]MAB93911.1 HD domain-containing protein [Alteromonas sp.]MAO31735.1 HD domain-containing protein [Alteromonas sp.]QPL49477.1 HD domain-containing protein [Alteromonas sp. B31-7]|tara:strand:+ start:17895 stop:18488 length:594 start_codon:yes stop_codon:yes gene_type:complete
MTLTPAQFSEFITELDKLKAVKRQITLPLDNDRQENSAEHSWHVALMATTLAPFAAQPIDISRVVRMILIHDVVEIDAGDLFAFQEAAEHEAQAEKELAAAKRIFGLLPAPLNQELLALWLEFEEAETPDAEFAKAMDRVLPVFQNMQNQGGSWKKHGVTREKIAQRNKHLITCAPSLWDYVNTQLDNAVKKGWLLP